MIIQGILGIIQVLFLPGILIIKFFPKIKGVWVTISAIIGLSLIFNYLLVFITTLLNIFSQPLVLIIFGIELVLLFVTYRNEFLSIDIETFFSNLWNALSQPLHALFPEISSEDNKEILKAVNYLLSLVFFVAALVAIEWISRFLRYNVGQVFNTWDAVNSWNKWATPWFQNRFPTGTEDYPQLFPTNWAMIYAFIGTTEIQFFSKAIMPIFSLLIMLVLLSLGIRHKNPGYFVSIILLRLIFKKFLMDYLASGYMDIPLAFFSLMAIIFLLMLHRSMDQKTKYSWYLLATVFASGAAVVKQAGLYILLSTVCIGFFLCFGFPNKKRIKDNWKQLLALFIIILIIVVPWYAIKNGQFLMGNDQSHLNYLLSDRNQIKNQGSITKALQHAMSSLGKYFYVFILVLPLMFFVNPFWRTILLVIVIPYTFLWSLFSSYDTRNLTLTFPLFSTTIGLGLWGLYNKTISFFRKINFSKLPIAIPILILTIFCAIGSLVAFDEDFLYERQIKLQKQLFSPSLNEKLLSFTVDKPKSISILTNYPIDQIPGIHGNKINSFFKDPEEFRRRIDSGTIDYILYPANSDPTIVHIIEKRIEEGAYSLIFNDPNWIPYTLVATSTR